MAPKTELKRALAAFQEREAAKSKITSHAGDLEKAGEGRFTKAEVLEQMFENTIKQTKSANTKKRMSNFLKEIQGNPELANDPKVWGFFTKGLPKNQKLTVFGDDTVDFWRQSDFGPHNIKTTDKFMKKHPYLTRDQAVKIQNMEPEDQIFEMKRLAAIRKRTANATGGRVPLWKGSMVESAPRQEMQKEIDMREGIYEMYKKRADEWKEKRDEYYNSPKYHDDSPLYPEVFDGPIQHADRPPEPELQIGPYVPERDTDYIVFDDGTIYYPEVDEYYKQDGTQVKGPSKGAKPEKHSETLEMEAAEGGRVPFVGGGWAFKLAEKYRQSKEYKKFIEKLFLKTSTDIRRGEGAFKNLSLDKKIQLHDDLTKEVTNYQKTGELPESAHQYFGFNPEQQYADRLLQKQLKMTPEEELRQEFPGITDDLLNQILTDTNQQRIAEVKATMKEALKMQEKGMGTEEIIQVIQKTPRTKNALGGLAHMVGE